jgi:hypothetical protein
VRGAKTVVRQKFDFGFEDEDAVDGMKRLISEEVRAFRDDVRAHARGAGSAKRQDRYSSPTRLPGRYLTHTAPACLSRRGTRFSLLPCARTRPWTAQRRHSPRLRTRCAPAARCSTTRAPSSIVSSRVAEHGRVCTSNGELPWEMHGVRFCGAACCCC